MENLNLPPFYIGQKVVYVGWKIVLKGTIHVVKGIYNAKCGCWIIISDSLPYDAYDTCGICDAKNVEIGKIGMAASFRPVQEAKPPLIKLTLSKIKETEKEQILIEN